MYSFSIYKSITKIGKEVWDECAKNGNPFLSYTFLKNLEDSAQKHPGYLIMLP